MSTGQIAVMLCGWGVIAGVAHSTWINVCMAGKPSHGGCEPHSEWHHDQFSCFCRDHDRDRLTDRLCYSVCNNRLHLASAEMWPN